MTLPGPATTLRAVNRSLVPFLLGACALGTTFASVRLVAPFYGSGPLLLSASLAVAFAATALGLALSALGEGPGRGRGAAALLVAAAATLLVPWVRVPVLVTLEPLGLRAAAVLALALFAGVPLAALAFALGRALRPPSDEAPGRAGAALPFAAAALGAACAAPLVVWVLVPLHGVARTLLAIGLVEALAAWLAGSGAGRRWLALTGVPLVVIVALSAARWPAVERDLPRGLVMAREGSAVQYRVVERTDGRFLLADGGIQTMVSSETREALVRPLAALRVIDLFFPQPESLLVLGLHGGGIPLRFARASWRVSVVEPDPLAVRMAEENLSFHAAEVRLTVDDVRRFCRRTSRRYPVVIDDAFDVGVAPAHLVTREALAEIGARVAPDGILALVIVTQGWNDPLLASLARMLGERFRTVLALPTSEPPDAIGSIVVLASDRDLALPDERLPQPTDYLMNLDEHWLVVQMTHAWFNRFVPPVRGAVVLTDDRDPIDLWSDRVLAASRVELHRSFAGMPRSW